MGKEKEGSDIAKRMMEGGIKESSSKSYNGKKNNNNGKKNKNNNRNGGQDWKNGRNNKSYGNKDNCKNFNGGKGNKQVDNSYVGAPYNFIPFNNDVVSVDKEQLLIHDVINDDMISGEISYKIKAESPIFISDGNGKDAQFTRNEKGEYIIPGSSVRGLIRNNVQILGLSSFDDDIEDYSLMYREVANGINKGRYKHILDNQPVNISEDSKAISVLLNVRAGYIGKKEDSYYIYKTEVDKINDKLKNMNYYVLSEKDMSYDKGYKENFSFFANNPNRLMNNIREGFEKSDINGKVQYKPVNGNNEYYKPGNYQISYEIEGLKKVVKVGEPGKHSKEGYIVSSGFMNEKKVHYIIPKIDRKKTPLELKREDVQAYKIDFENKKNTLKGKEVFFDLPKEDETKPVFYIELGGRVYFGFTPRLRLFYDHSVKEGYKQTTVEFDYARSIFGTINEKSAYKSKVSFTDAKLDDDVKPGEKKEIILSSPKPTSYRDYIDQSKGDATYNSDEFELRGIKQYWLHDMNDVNIESKNKNVASTLRPFDKGVSFTGKLRFNNLTKAELGVLLWSIKLEKDSMMNIGQGKPYGFGIISVSDITLKIVDNKKAYNVSNALDFSPFKEGNVDEYIDCYKKVVSESIGGKRIDELPSVVAFFNMKDSINKPNKEKVRYMRIDAKEYQNRKKALPAINDIMKKSLLEK